MEKYLINQSKRKLLNGECVFGLALIDLHGVTLPHVLAQAGYDSLFLDMEHSPDGFGSICDLVWCCRRSGITPVVRVPDPEHCHLSRCLDAGAQGVIVPRVESVAQVERIVSCCRYPPAGTRGVALVGRHSDYRSSSDWKRTMKEANKQVLVGVMIETAQGMKLLDEIAACAGIDMLFIGPADLSLAVGTPGEFTSEPVERAIRRIVLAAERNGLVVGIQGMNVELCAHWMKMGARYVLMGSALTLLRQSGQLGVAQLREVAKLEEQNRLRRNRRR